MDWPRLDTRWWNLTLGAVATTAMSACGPTVFLDDGGGSASATDGESDSDGPETTPTDTTPPPPGPECENSSDCEPGYECIDDICQPYGYYCDDGCCEGGCYYYECYSNEDCGPGSLCTDYNSCLPVETLAGCGDEAVLIPLPLPVDDADPIVSLAFVDGDLDEPQELLVGRTGGAELYDGAEPPVPLPLPEGESVWDAASGDFDGDGDPDLAIASSLGITILAGDGAGGFTEVSTTILEDAPRQIFPVQWDDGGTLDLAVRTGGGNVAILFGDGAGAIANVAEVPLKAEAQSLAAGRFDEDAFDEIFVDDVGYPRVYFGNGPGDTDASQTLWGDGSPLGPGILLAGDLGGDGTVELFRRDSQIGGWEVIEVWQDTEITPQRIALLDEGQASALGDYDGDGIRDLVVGGGQMVHLMRGNDSGVLLPLDCQSIVPVETLVEHMAMGDLDGDGRAEIATASGGVVTVYSTLL